MSNGAFGRIGGSKAVATCKRSMVEKSTSRHYPSVASQGYHGIATPTQVIRKGVYSFLSNPQSATGQKSNFEVDAKKQKNKPVIRRDSTRFAHAETEMRVACNASAVPAQRR